MKLDAWDTDARKRLTRWILTAERRGRGSAYAPDTTYEQVKRGECGPHTLAVADVLQRWAQMWAADMRESAARRAEGFDLDIDADAQWLANMVSADAEIDRYLAANRLGRAA